MAIFQLNDTLVFPKPELAEKNGLLAIGGDLSVERLLSAYSQGIFPWFSEGDPPLWWFTDPRLVLFPNEFHVSRRLVRTLRNCEFRTTFDVDFEAVIHSCADVRASKKEGTWISPDMEKAFIALHLAGFAHSVECWLHDELVGGLYGVQIGKVFFGESMFTRKSNASKVALVALVSHLQRQDVQLIDCQMTTDHLISFGAREISGRDFTQFLEKHISHSEFN
jgi:leucyl/phenylalanyl-tRNA--protein transferase